MPAPDLSAPLFAWLLLPVAILLGFFLPGHLIFRTLPGPLPWARAFVGSVLALFLTVLLFNATGIPITLVTLTAGLAILSVVGWVLAGRPAFAFPRWPVIRLTWRDLWWLLPCLAALATVLARALIEPLSGWDNIFRWNHLALLIRAQESLTAYPPVSAADFRVYPWCDGIPPALSLTNLWIYLGTGSTYGGLIAGRIAVEFALTSALVWHLAEKLWGAAGARLAVAVLATSSLFMWSLANGQETGLSGVAVLLLAACIIHYREKPELGTAIWALLAASLAALTRDYNLLFLPVATLLLLLLGAPRRHWLLASAAAAVVVLPWYLRNAWLTGNPLYAQDLGGLLPTNAYHREFMASVRGYWSLVVQRASLGYLLQLVSIGGGVVLVLGATGLLRRDARLRGLQCLAATGIILWLLSVSSTAGGWGYSLRVLGPVLPLFAISAGWLATQMRPTQLALAGLALCPFTVDAARRSWLIPIDFHEAPWPYSWQSWRQAAASFKELSYPAVWPVLAGAAESEAIIVDHPMNVIHGGQAGGLMIFLASPEADALLRPAATDFATVRRSLRARNIRFLVLSIDTPMNRHLLVAWPALRAVRATEPTLKIDGMLIYDLALSADEPPPRRRLVTGP